MRDDRTTIYTIIPDMTYKGLKGNLEVQFLLGDMIGLFRTETRNIPLSEQEVIDTVGYKQLKFLGMID